MIQSHTRKDARLAATRRGGALVWAGVLGVVVGYVALLVHRGRAGGLPWGLILAWALVLAAGVHVRAGKGLWPAALFTAAALGTPLALVYLWPGGNLLVLGDWRSTWWYIGFAVLALLALAFGAATRNPKEVQ